jgi:hypothetical protein
MSEYGRQDWSKVSANPIVDWGGLAKGFSEQLATQEQARIAKRKEIDDNTSTALKDLQNYTVGNNANVNSVITSGSDAYTTLLKNQYDQVKKGLADPRQFQLLLKNSQDSFGYLKKVGETWNTRADELQKRSNEGVNSVIEIEKAKLDAGLEQFQNIRIMPNSDGQMYMYHNNDDGSVNKSIPPTSISSLLNPANTKVDKVDVAKSTAPIAKTVADYIKRSGSRSLGEFTNDPVHRESYKKFADGAANTLTATPIQTASILADGMGKLLSWTEEDYKKNPDSVYMKMVNGVMTPQITPEQYTKAKNHIKETLESQIVYEEKQQYQPQRASSSGPSEASIKARQDKEKAALNYGLYVKLAAGGDVGEAAKNSINNSLTGNQITKITRTPSQMTVIVQDADGNQTPHTVSLLRDGKPIDNVDVAQQLYGLTNPTNVIESDRLSYIDMYGGAGPTRTTPETKGNVRAKTVDLMRDKGPSGTKTFTQELLDKNDAEDQVDIYSYALDKTGLDPSLYNISYNNAAFGDDFVIFKDSSGNEIGRIEESEPAASKKAKFNRIVQRINNPKASSSSGSSKETPQQRAARIANQK